MRIIDLTQTVHYHMHTFESYPKPLTIPWAKQDVHGYEAELIFMSSHTGTHMDAPFHFFPKGKKIHEIAVEKFVSDAHLVKMQKGSKGYITEEDVRKFENSSRLEKGSAVVFSTGWERHSNRKDYLRGSPGLSVEAAKYLSDLKVSLVGIDSANIDHPLAKDFPVHKILLSKGVLIVENLCNLSKVKQREFKLVVLPLKIEATGSPVRALAMV